MLGSITIYHIAYDMCSSVVSLLVEVVFLIRHLKMPRVQSSENQLNWEPLKEEVQN